MPDDVGGQPFQDGEEPEYRHHGDADDEFASVVLDEAFVRAAEVHEPTAVERILAAAQSRAENEPPRSLEERYRKYRRYRRRGADGEFEAESEAESDADEGDEEYEDDDGRFDRSDYQEYGEFADGDDLGPHIYPAYGPYVHDYDPGFDPAYEHGADYGYAYGGGTGVPGHLDGPYGSHGGTLSPYRGHGRWQRPVAWVLAVVMGIGMVALAFSALYRGGSGQRQDPSPPPATSGVGSPANGHDAMPGALPSASAETGAPAASAEPR